jgi:membrane fusion protein (multidrug efflux system)
MNKLTRQISIVAAIVVLGGFIVVSQMLSKEPPQEKRANNPLKQTPQVETLMVQNEDIPFTIPIQGRLVAFDKIDIFSEVNGPLLSSSRAFKEGTRFQKGDVLLKIDREEARLNLLAQKSALLNAVTQFMPDLKIDYPKSFTQWKSYLDQFDVEKTLKPFPDPLSEQEKYFIASRNILNQYYSIKSAEARLEKYTIYAPFTGVITQANINPGAVVRAGQQLGVLMSTTSYELEATMPVSELKYIKTGRPVKVYSEDVEQEWSGKVKRINDQIDPATQTATIYVGLSGKGLREGMYLKGDVQAGAVENAFRLDRNLLIDEKAVFLVKDTMLQRIPVELVRIELNKAIIKGVPEGSLLLAQRIPGAYNGMRIRVEGSK